VGARDIGQVSHSGVDGLDQVLVVGLILISLLASGSSFPSLRGRKRPRPSPPPPSWSGPWPVHSAGPAGPATPASRWWLHARNRPSAAGHFQPRRHGPFDQIRQAAVNALAGRLAVRRVLGFVVRARIAGFSTMKHRLACLLVDVGILRGFPCPPTMVRGEQSSPAPHATFRYGLRRKPRRDMLPAVTGGNALDRSGAATPGMGAPAVPVDSAQAARRSARYRRPLRRLLRAYRVTLQNCAVLRAPAHAPALPRRRSRGRTGASGSSTKRPPGPGHHRRVAGTVHQGRAAYQRDGQHAA